jgi:hypothetical protein
MLLDAGMFEAARTAAAAMAMAGARTCLRRAVRFVTGIARSVPRPTLVTEAAAGMPADEEAVELVRRLLGVTLILLLWPLGFSRLFDEAEVVAEAAWRAVSARPGFADLGATFLATDALEPVKAGDGAAVEAASRVGAKAAVPEEDEAEPKVAPTLVRTWAVAMGVAP